MGWKETLRDATFRGVPFNISDSDNSASERRARFYTPGKDGSISQSLGKSSKSYNLNGFVLGEDYITKRNALIASLEDSSEGLLVHPFYGEMIVEVDGYSISESTAEGGIAYFSIRFMEVKPQEKLLVNIPLDSDYAFSYTSMAEVQKNNFVELYSKYRIPFVLLGKLENILQTFSGLITSAYSQFMQIVEFAERVVMLYNDALRLLKSIQELGDLIWNIVTFNVDLDTPIPDKDILKQSQARKMALMVQQELNPDLYKTTQEKELIQFLHRLVFISIPFFASKMELKRKKDLLETTDKISNLIWQEVTATTDIDYILQLRNSHNLFYRSMKSKSKNTIAIQSTSPTLVSVYEATGNVDSELEIIYYNSVDNPGIPNVDKLEVIV